MGERKLWYFRTEAKLEEQFAVAIGEVGEGGAHGWIWPEERRGEVGTILIPPEIVWRCHMDAGRKIRIKPASAAYLWRMTGTGSEGDSPRYTWTGRQSIRRYG